MLTQDCNLEHYEKNYKDTYKKNKNKGEEKPGKLVGGIIYLPALCCSCICPEEGMTYPVIGATANNPLMCTLFLFGGPYLS